MAVSVWIGGCEEAKLDPVAAVAATLPPNAKNIVVLGNGWSTFELETSDHRIDKFLYRSPTDYCVRGDHFFTREVITKISSHSQAEITAQEPTHEKDKQ